MNEKKICFITCVNRADYEQEELRYIHSLVVPDGYEVEVLSIWEADSMTSGYNEGMQSSDAKYKVYLHQDVFIVNRYFIFDLLEIFQEEAIGMVGMVGSPKMPENAIMWNGDRIGKLYFNVIYNAGSSLFGQPIQGTYQEVEAVDGLLIATQYDLPWREDLFQKWDFYDVSQSYEFRRAGYKVVVPKQKEPWCIHDDGFVNLKNYYGQRRIFIDHYKNEKKTGE